MSSECSGGRIGSLQRGSLLNVRNHCLIVLLASKLLVPAYVPAEPGKTPIKGDTPWGGKLDKIRYYAY